MNALKKKLLIERLLADARFADYYGNHSTAALLREAAQALKNKQKRKAKR